MKPSASTKAWWGRLGLLLFIMGLAGMSLSPDAWAPLLVFIIGFLLALQVGWTKGDHE